MQLPQTQTLVRVHYLDTCDSTNTQLRQLVSAQPQLQPLLLVTGKQTAGRGRAGRQWRDVPGQALASSLFMPQLAPGAVGTTWLPLLAGTALATAVRQWTRVVVKWPNDVLVIPQGQTHWDELSRARGGLKIAGLLCEVVPGGVIVGAGVNLLTPQAQLPPGAASLRSLGVIAADADFAALADALLAVYVQQFFTLCRLGEREPDKLRATVTANLATLGATVRVIAPDHGEVVGVATGLDAHGQLIVVDTAGVRSVHAAGDVEHLRLS